MGKHRKEGGHPPKAALPLRNKVVAAVVAGGAFAAVGQPLATAGETEAPERSAAVHPLAASKKLSLALTGTSSSPASVQLLAQETATDSVEESGRIDKSEAIERARAEAERARQEAERAAAEAERAAEEAARKAASGFVKPAEGTFTSGFGARWGTNHNGIDIANSIGTPIRAVAAGTVVEAGPASGFGQWIRLQHKDGTITVYGHINTIDVSEGEQVGAGEQIATMGNRGQSTGPHLHFEVHVGGSKINPLPWLSARGIEV
ncbi:Murein DD-endopeptidase MepM and murein hydrolase activator NlpD, contain LysM domain [Saccharopolyspora kobensis]|uniref:Murein DD-endopeptidase MepM and murein hydrolase activator NlpD, contain LysM domain n=1 Tax=Saccharopolyspora kobensis TaxID=146035 RepID=A0A1H6C4R1_9PSEU|nr:M23 family metallopeptidase [Saccharopolyspora kobensis]SEG67951.1 Murein DD-endopeptidase MepM and murein hydrolase activator NlpD, contain LysM domain [Saccharopolyspora kobensis]SFC28152.1 Murein DD-endopeptidase MepM and murein hydrolase activator NlpD, contain LysM domain [Saccharopolyspora kobensis]